MFDAISKMMDYTSLVAVRHFRLMTEADVCVYLLTHSSSRYTIKLNLNDDDDDDAENDNCLSNRKCQSSAL